MGRDAISALVVGAAHSALMLLLLAGHGPWAGRPLVALAGTHGINAGDVPVLAAWAVGMAGIWRLHRSTARSPRDR